MLPVKYRIRKDSLPLVLKQNKVFPSVYLDLRVHNRLSTEFNYGQSSRVAVVIPNKVSPLSTSRHLIKRRIHAVLEKIWPDLSFSKDIIVQIKKSPLELSREELEKEIFGVLRTAKVFK